MMPIVPRRGLPYFRYPDTWHPPTIHGPGYNVYAWNIGAHGFIAVAEPGTRRWWAMPRGPICETMQGEV